VILALAAAILAGGIASISGFGVGSILTPYLNIEHDIRLAVAAVSIPHVAATALRFWMIRDHVNRKVFRSFGSMSAAGGLAGALLGAVVTSRALELTLASLLVFAGAMGLTGLVSRMRFGGTAGMVAGAASGLLGGLVGNQGGIRSAALLGFHLPRESFVATATAIALVIDGARLPVYLYAYGAEMLRIWPVVAVTALGAVIGTVAGRGVLGRIPEPLFQHVVGMLILALGISMLVR
jgi:uncharacterized membrane protein YfcA